MGGKILRPSGEERKTKANPKSQIFRQPSFAMSSGSGPGSSGETWVAKYYDYFAKSENQRPTEESDFSSSPASWPIEEVNLLAD
jgi:hypothetical protein